jgi:predicted DNA-binding transcriptional regulator YafY
VAKVDKFERLMNLTATLLDTEVPLTATELHKRIPGYPTDRESFRRSFERDKDDLREMGIPLQITPKPGADMPIDAYRIRKDEYFLRDPGLTPDELAALHLAASVTHLEDAQGTALWKLGGVPESDAVEVPISPLVDLSGSVEVLFGAVVDRRRVRFGYHDAVRELRPYRLDYQRGHWYLSAHDETRGETRVFRTDRIQGDVAVIGPPKAFDVPAGSVPGLRLEPWQIGLDQPVTTRLRVDAEVAPAVTHHLGNDAIVASNDDGSVEFELQVSNPTGFRNYVLGLLDHAEVLAPPEARADLRQWLAAVVAEVS